jgi:hypothetical protein
VSARHGRMDQRAARRRGDGEAALTGAPRGSDEEGGGGGRQRPWSSSFAQGHGEEHLGLLGGGWDGLATRLTAKERWRRRDDGAGARRQRGTRGSAERALPHRGEAVRPDRADGSALSGAVDGGVPATEVDGGAGPVRWPGGGELGPTSRALPRRSFCTWVRGEWRGEASGRWWRRRLGKTGEGLAIEGGAGRRRRCGLLARRSASRLGRVRKSGRRQHEWKGGGDQCLNSPGARAAIWARCRLARPTEGKQRGSQGGPVGDERVVAEACSVPLSLRRCFAGARALSAGWRSSGDGRHAAWRSERPTQMASGGKGAQALLVRERTAAGACRESWVQRRWVGRRGGRQGLGMKAAAATDGWGRGERKWPVRWPAAGARVNGPAVGGSGSRVRPIREGK